MKLEERIRRSIKQRAGNVILRSEFTWMGSAPQISTVLKNLQDKGMLIRIGTGVYAKTRKSSVTGATIPAESLETLATESLQKLGVPVSSGRTAAAYNAGETSQLPGTFIANTGNRRISRKITVSGRTVTYENNYSRAKPSGHFG